MKRSLPLLVVLGLGMGLRLARGADPAPMPQAEIPQTMAEIKGHVKSVDPHASSLVIEDEANQRVALAVGKDTRVLDSNNHLLKWSALRPGDKVLVYYNKNEQTATQIDVLPTAADAVIGTPKIELR